MVWAFGAGLMMPKMHEAALAFISVPDAALDGKLGWGKENQVS